MKRRWTREELADHWVLAPKELELLANKTGATRLGFAVLLKSFIHEGRFPRQKHDVPGAVVVHLANQVQVSADLYPSYEWSGRTIEYHRAQIREFLGFREATVQDGHEFVEWLAEHVLPTEHGEDHGGFHAASTGSLSAQAPFLGEVPQYAANYVDLPPGAGAVTFSGNASVPLIAAPVDAGGAWWSNRGDSMDSRLTRSVDLRGVADATLRFRA